MMIDLNEVLITTRTAHAGMLVREVFDECARAHVQALPFCDGAGRVAGRVTLKNIMKYSCLPEYMVDTAQLLGSHLSCIGDAEEKIKEVLKNPVETYVRRVIGTISSRSPVIQALAAMEQKDTSYIFVVDEDLYKGIVTIQGIAHAMSKLAPGSSDVQEPRGP